MPTAPDDAPRHGPKVVFALGLILLIPLALIFFVFPMVAEETFSRVEDLDPATVKTLRVHLLNRQGVDDGPDVGPFVAAPADVPILLDALRSVPEVDDFVGARGPWLGDYRVVTAEGRRGTVRFYWQPPTERSAKPVLRYQIGQRKFEGGDLPGLIRAIEAAAKK